MASAAAALVLDVVDAVVAYDDGPVGGGSARSDGGSFGLGNTYPAEVARGFRK